MAAPTGAAPSGPVDPAGGPVLLFGLGNPGARYRITRHNLGFLLLDRLEQLWQLRPEAGPGDYVRSAGRIEGRPIVMIRPLTYMNLSGRAVRQALAAEKSDRSKILVAVDDVALDLGKVRLRARGSAGGHNGLRSIEASLGTAEYARLRMGCGPAPEEMDLADYVLDEFDESEWDAVEEMLEHAAKAARNWVLEGTESTMARFNR